MSKGWQTELMGAENTGPGGRHKDLMLCKMESHSKRITLAALLRMDGRGASVRARQPLRRLLWSPRH